ncbi:hypothetical protein [Acidovorax sp.]|uniref:hypothetical protein n=1 Tax=Acidovorax sp. TaxID=1872122 RepID=UPI00391F74AF
MNRRNLTTLLAGAALVAAALPHAAMAQDSGQPIRLIVPYAPGGPIDVTARALAEPVANTPAPFDIFNAADRASYLRGDSHAIAPDD